ncbi:MAG: hypothetical protein HQL47_05625 [Gammaproteobacteria bacterium]|nr:hypothetical protein [Gammaproteobacteria bacterium]
MALATLEQLRDWNQLSSKDQLELRIEFGHYLDELPPTCALNLKLDYFRSWLADQGIHYQAPASRLGFTPAGPAGAAVVPPAPRR